MRRPPLRLLLALAPVVLAVAIPCGLHAADQAAAPSAAAATTVSPDQAPADKAPRRILFSIEKGLISGYSDDEMVILKRSFLTALSEADGAPTPIDAGSSGLPSSTADRNKAARAAGADCWLVMKLSGLRGSPSINVAAFDLLYNIKSLDFTASRSEGFSMLELYREQWDDVIRPVLKKFPPLVSHAYSRGPPSAVTLTIHAVPGTTITGLSPQAVKVGADGTASIQLASPAPYSLRAAAGGYVPSRMSFYLDGQAEITLQQTSSPWLKLDGAFLDGFFPGLAATFALPSFPAFARLGFTTFRAGVSVNSDQFAVSLPLSQVTLLLGFYISPEDRPTRFYLGAGPLLRLSLPPGGSFTIDQLLPFGIQVVGGVEFPLAGKLRTFIEYAPTVYYTPLPLLFQYSFSNNNGTFPFVNFPPTFAINILELRIGVRLSL
jgi:hypothetical protein